MTTRGEALEALKAASLRQTEATQAFINNPTQVNHYVLTVAQEMMDDAIDDFIEKWDLEDDLP